MHGSGSPLAMSLPVAVTSVFVGALVVAVGIAGRRGRLTRNWLAGIRTVASMRSDLAFAVANRAGSGPMILGGAIALLAGLLAVPIGLVLGGTAGLACGLTGVLALVVLAVVGGVLGSRAARRADPDPDR